MGGHWTIYFLSFKFFRSSLDELWLPLAILTIIYMAVYALPLFYIYFINWLAEKRPNHSLGGGNNRSPAANSRTLGRSEGFAEVMQLPKWNIQSNNTYSETYEDLINKNKSAREN